MTLRMKMKYYELVVWTELLSFYTKLEAI